MVDIIGANLVSLQTYLASLSASSTGISTGAALNTAGSAVVGVDPPMVNVADYSPTGNGVANDATAFNAAKATNKLVCIPPPATAYNFTTTVSTEANAWLPDPTISWADLTDSGQLDIQRGFFTDQLDGGNIWRLADRVFVGQAAGKFAGNFSTSAGEAGNSSWSDPDEACTYIGVNAHLLSISGGSADAGGNSGGYAIAGLSRGTDTLGTGIIGVAGAIINDKADGRAWGIYSDLQHETGAWVSNGIEVAAKNKSTDNFTYSPYTATFGVFGARLVGGGDSAEGGDAINPSNSAIIVIKGDLSYGWNRGIVFRNDALTGTDGSVGSSSNATAIAMARRHAITWYAPDDVAGATLVSTITDGDNAVTCQFFDNGFNLLGVNGKQFFRANHTASGVNYISIASGATGNAASVSVLGDDTNIDLQLSGKGTGVLRYGTHSAIAAETVTGYITIKDIGGTVRKLAVVS